MNNNHGIRNKQTSDGGFGIFWDEYRSIEQSNPPPPSQPDSEDGSNKKEDKAESEIQWLNDVGFTNIAKKIRARTEIDGNDDDMKIIAASLTRAQANAVRRRIDSLNEAIRQRKQQPENQYPSDRANRNKRKDVRNLFGVVNRTPAATLAAQNTQRNNEEAATHRRHDYKGQRFISIPSQDKQNSKLGKSADVNDMKPSVTSSRSSFDFTAKDSTTSSYKRSQSMDFPKPPSSPTMKRVLQHTPQEDNLVRRTSSQSRLILMSGEERQRSLNEIDENGKSTVVVLRRNTDAGPRTRNINNNEQRRKSAVQERSTDTTEKTHRKTLSTDGLVNMYHMQGNAVIMSPIAQETPNKHFVAGGEKRLVIVDSKYINISSVENTYNNVQCNANSTSPRIPNGEQGIVNNARQVHMPSHENQRKSQTYNLPTPPTEELKLPSPIEDKKLPIHTLDPAINGTFTPIEVKKERLPKKEGSPKKEHAHHHKTKPEKKIKNAKTPKRTTSEKPKPSVDNQLDLKLNKTNSSPIPAIIKVNGTCTQSGSDDSKSLSSLGSLGSSDDLQIPRVANNKSTDPTIIDHKTDSYRNVQIKVEVSRTRESEIQASLTKTDINENPNESSTPQSESSGDGLEGDAKLNFDGSLGSPRDSANLTEAVSGPSFPPLPNFTLTHEELGKTHIGDLAEEDMVKVRSLALLELTALFDAYTIPMNRRKPLTKIKHKDNGMFGVPLTILSQREEKKKDPGIKAPRIFCEMLSFLEKKGLQEEGIFRIPGATPRVKSFREECDKNNWDGLNWETKKVSDISTCLKQFLRDLPIPLLSHEYQNTFTSVANLPNRKVQLQALNLLVLLLHPIHQETLRLLLVFLQKIVQNEAKNKMGLSNVAMIMAPNLLFQNTAKINVDEAQKAAGMTDVLRMLIKYQEILWTIPAFMVGQIRYLYEAGAKTKDPKAVRKIIAKRLRNESSLGHRSKSSGSSGDELDEESYIIRVKAPSLNKQSMAIQLSALTTAGDVIAKFQWRRQNSQKEKDEIDHSRLSINRNSKKKDSNLELYLCECGGNIGERRLDAAANLAAILKANPNAEWVLKGVKR